MDRRSFFKSAARLIAFLGVSGLAVGSSGAIARDVGGLEMIPTEFNDAVMYTPIVYGDVFQIVEHKPKLKRRV